VGPAVAIVKGAHVRVMRLNFVVAFLCCFFACFFAVVDLGFAWFFFF